MAVTEIEQLLVDCLSLSRASEGGQALAFIALDTEDQMLKMCRFLSDNEMATKEQHSAGTEDRADGLLW